MKLTCHDFTPFIDAYVDGEFTDAERVELDAHLDQCEHCREEVELRVQFKEAVKQSCQTERAPDHLRVNVLDMLQAEAQRMNVAEQAETRRQSRRRFAAAAMPLAAAALLAMVLPAFTIASSSASSSSQPVIEQTLEWHRGNYPLEISSPRSAKVATWFVGKVDFPVRLPRFAQKDAKLLGARLASVQNRKAAYALYTIDGARVSVMMFHGEHLKVPGDTIQTIADHKVAMMNSKGYDIAILQSDGVTYAVTSELPRERFLKLMEHSLRN